jgi:hypothetical protein
MVRMMCLVDRGRDMRCAQDDKTEWAALLGVVPMLALMGVLKMEHLLAPHESARDT